MTPESAIKNSILSYLALKGIFAWPNDTIGVYDPKKKVFRMNKNVHRIKGVSDILGIMKDGRFLAIEVKTAKPKTYPTVEQKFFIQTVLHFGGLAFVARSIDDVKEHLG